MNRKKNSKKKSKSKNRNELAGSFSGGGGGKNSNTLKYAFLRPETPPDGGQREDCRPPSSISAFSFMNFALAAITIGANLVSLFVVLAILIPIFGR